MDGEKNILRFLFYAALGLGVVYMGWVLYRLNTRPSLQPYQEYFHAEKEGKIQVTYLGVSTLLITDGETSLMTDAFFSRPGGWWKLGTQKIAPDTTRIHESLKKLSVKQLDAILVAHAHHSHVMDAPEVAQCTQARVLGSLSTANVCRGWNLAEEQVKVVKPGQPEKYGRFKVTFIRSKHLSLLSLSSAKPGTEITEPLEPPAGVKDYREESTYSILLEHPAGTILVQSSAGFEPGRLEKYKADVVFLGIGGLGKQKAGYRQAYFKEVVKATGAKKIIPIHWDDFTRPLSEPLRPFPYLTDNLKKTMRFLKQKTNSEGIEMSMLQGWETIGLF